MVDMDIQVGYLMGPNLTPAPLTLALITPVITPNLAEYKKVFIFAFNGNIRQKISWKERVHVKDKIYQISKKEKFSKIWHPFSKMALIMPI